MNPDKADSVLILETLSHGNIVSDVDRLQRSEQQEWTPKRVESYLTPDYAERLSADINDALAAERQRRETIEVAAKLAHEASLGLVKHAEDQLLSERQRREQAEQGYEICITDLNNAITKIQDTQTQLLSAQAAIEAHNRLGWNKESGMRIEVDLSLLHQHDEAVRKSCSLVKAEDLENHDAEVRKPLVELLEEVLAQTVNTPVYPDGPCLDGDLRNDIKAALVQCKP